MSVESSSIPEKKKTWHFLLILFCLVATVYPTSSPRIAASRTLVLKCVPTSQFERKHQIKQCIFSLPPHPHQPNSQKIQSGLMNLKLMANLYESGH